jgi:hypothetical protein
MSRLLPICATGFLLLCTHSSVAQTSTQSFIADPKAAYAAIKSVMLKVDKNIGKPVLDKGKFNIATCADASLYIMVTKRKYDDELLFATIGFTAANVLDWSRALTALGYPRSVWEPLVDKYETEELAAGIRANASGQQQLKKFAERQVNRTGEVQNQLAIILDKYRKAHPSLPRVVYEPGCGAGEVSVKIVTDPRGGRAMFIPTFFYELCQAQGLDPEGSGSPSPLIR